MKVGGVIPIVSGALVTVTKGMVRPKDSITKIDQNTEKNPGDLKRLADTQTPVRNHQLTLVLKI